MILHDFNRSGGGMGSSSQLGVGGGAVGGVGGAIGGSAGQQLASTNPRGYSSFTESDQDGSSAVVSLNGTQIVMNNMARSRAPLPGFSSFVWRTTSQCSLSPHEIRCAILWFCCDLKKVHGCASSSKKKKKYLRITVIRPDPWGGSHFCIWKVLILSKFGKP